MSDTLFEIRLEDDPSVVLFAQRLRDGRVAFGSRPVSGDEDRGGEIHVLEPRAFLALAAWLTGPVVESWIETVRDHLPAQLHTARDLYGGDPGSLERLAGEMLRQVPPGLIVRALILLVNSLGPEVRERHVARLNETASASEEAELRHRLHEEGEAFGYGVAAAALFDAIARGVDADE